VIELYALEVVVEEMGVIRSLPFEVLDRY